MWTLTQGACRVQRWPGEIGETERDGKKRKGEKTSNFFVLSHQSTTAAIRNRERTYLVESGLGELASGLLVLQDL